MGPFFRNKVVRFSSVIAVCIYTALSLSSCKEKQEVAPHKPPVVSVVEVTPRDVPSIFEFVAQTQSSHLVNIQARVSGFLDKQVYTEGAVVKEGQVLFLMDAKPFRYQLDQAKAALSMCKVSLETARSNLARTKPLTEQNALSQSDLDNATGQFQSAAAAVEQSRAQVETAQLNLSYTTITSPISGITSAARQSEGTYISTQSSLLTTVAVLSPIWVNFSISENEMQRFRSQIEKGLIQMPKDQSYIVEIILVDGSIYPHTGRITFAEPSYNSQTGTFMIRASVDNPKGALRPNQYVRVRLKGAIRPNAILVPQAAIQRGSKGHFVWVVDKNSRVDQRPIVVGDWYKDDWLIFEGLGVGEQVVIEGTLSLRPDMSVTVKPYKPEAVSAGLKAEADSAKSEK